MKISLLRPVNAPEWWDAAAKSIEGALRRIAAPNKFTVATLPDPAGREGEPPIYVSDEVDGATLAFSDGLAWRRVQDRNIVS